MRTRENWIGDPHEALGGPSLRSSNLTERGIKPAVWLACLQLSGFPLNFGIMPELFIWVVINLQYYKESWDATLVNISLRNFLLSPDYNFLLFPAMMPHPPNFPFAIIFGMYSEWMQYNIFSRISHLRTSTIWKSIINNTFCWFASFSSFSYVLSFFPFFFFLVWSTSTLVLGKMSFLSAFRFFPRIFLQLLFP